MNEENKSFTTPLANLPKLKQLIEKYDKLNISYTVDDVVNVVALNADNNKIDYIKFLVDIEGL